MLAKVVAWGPDRDQAARRLTAALRRARLHGLRTNRDLLVEVLTHPVFLAGDVSTDFLAEQDLRSMEARALPGDATQQALMFFAAAVATTEATAAHRSVQGRIPNGWRNVVSAPQTTRFACDVSELPAGATAEESGVVAVGWHAGRDGYRSADLEGARATSVEQRDGRWRVTVEHDGVSHAFEVFVGDAPGSNRVDVESVLGHLALGVVPRFTDPADQVAAGSLLAPMPGSVISVPVGAGDAVAAGQAVLVLEAMKMQHTVAAPYDGVVTDLPVSVGDQVAAGAVLAVVQQDTETPQPTPVEAGAQGDHA